MPTLKGAVVHKNYFSPKLPVSLGHPTAGSTFVPLPVFPQVMDNCRGKERVNYYIVKSPFLATKDANLVHLQLITTR